MNKILTQREQDKKGLLFRAKILVKKIEASGMKQGHIAEKIKVSDQTLSKFMSLKEDYITKRICDALEQYFEDTFKR